MAHFGGSDAAVAPVTLRAAGATAAFSSCEFSGNAIGAERGGVVAAHSSSAVRLEDCQFTGNTGSGYILTNPEGEAAFFSDPESVRELDHQYEIGADVTLAPLSMAPASTQFLAATDGWFVETAQVCGSALVAAPALHMHAPCARMGHAGVHLRRV